MKLFFTYLCVVIAQLTQAQSAAQVAMPEVGKPLPEFTLNQINQFKKSTVTNNDFKGKWLFLDFWSIRCVTCIHSFPLANEISQQFKQELNWVMVGINNKKMNPGTEVFYEKIRSKQNLQMPYAFDSLLANQWEIHSLPHIIIVNPEGIVYAITSGRDLNKDKVQQLVAGQQVSFYVKDQPRKEFEPPSLNSNSNDEISADKLLLYSVLTEWNGEKQSVGVEFDRWITWSPKYLVKGFELAMVPLYGLYNYAYFGRWDWDTDSPFYNTTYPYPILEMADTSLFIYDYKSDFRKGTYNYRLRIPLAEISVERMMSLMQGDLNRAFRYEARIETRSMPVWKLIAAPGAAQKLITKGGPKYIPAGTHAAGYTFKNVPIYYLIGGIRFYLKERKKELFIDETGITDNIDFSIEADMTNLADIRNELKKQGLDLVRGHKDLKVLVISDRSN